MPLPAVAAPEPCGVPAFAPLRVRGGWGRFRLRRAMRRRRRALAAGLAVTAAALAAWGARAPVGAAPAPHGEPVAVRQHRPKPVEMVSAPVRIADAETVRLLRPGDRVDVIAAADSPTGAASDARVVATGARVAEVPRARETFPEAGGGALIVLSVPRPVAAALAGAGTTSRLAVTLC
ncbi:hypothetical protein [Streptomyces sp. NPDC000410]|uniref:hypothetical protein n=1 Tax=Streptomyces sp. NPDC000410 TaxID=3154254 RepID=UPI00332C70A0